MSGFDENVSGVWRSWRDQEVADDGQVNCAPFPSTQKSVRYQAALFCWVISEVVVPMRPLKAEVAFLPKVAIAVAAVVVLVELTAGPGLAE